MESLITVLSSAAVSTGLAGLVVWLTKSWIGEHLQNAIKHQYDVKLESHKEQLKAANDRDFEAYKHHAELEVEKLKSTLQIAAAEHQVRFNRLHEVRAEAIAELYSKTVEHEIDARRLIYGYLGMDPSLRETRVEEVAEKYRDSRSYFLKHKIYFDASICEKLDRYYQEISEVSFGFSVQLQLGTPPGDDEGYKVWQKALDVMQKHIPSVKHALENDFRHLLGVHSRARPS